jgi:hypothetical protein
MRRRLGLPLLLAAALVAGCGEDDEEKAPSERADRAAKPPRGWRTVSNHSAGFTIAAPRRWTARTRKGATLIRSDDRLVVVTVAADRSEEGRGTHPARYARLTLLNLPEFEGRVSPRVRRVRGSPYGSARVDGFGTVRTSRRLQRITVATYRLPGRVTYTAVVFRNPRLTPGFDETIVNRMLRTVRG